MTIRELKEVLSSCNDEDRIYIEGWDVGLMEIEKRQIFYDPDKKEVIIDLEDVVEMP